MTNRQYIKYSPATIANNFLWFAQEEEASISPMKLQKLVYFAYGWSLALLNHKLFDEGIEAWRHGPVIPSLYYEFQRFGGEAIDTFASRTKVNPATGEIAKVSYPVIDLEQKDILSIVSAVWNSYKDCEPWEVSNITHETDSPWDKAKNRGGFKPELDDSEIAQRSLEGIKKRYENVQH